MSDHEEPKKVLVLPTRRKGEHSNMFRECRIISNHYLVELKDINIITIFSVKYEPFIPHDNSQLRNKLLK
jgi:hypothetical protein